MFVLGVSFSPESIPEPLYESLEIILVSQKSDEAPEKADMLAQANLKGGGETEKLERPAAPIPTLLPAPSPEIAAVPAPPPEPETDQHEQRAKAAKAAATNEETELLVQETPKPDRPLPKPAATPEPIRKAPETEPLEQTAKPKLDTPVMPTASQLITRSFAIASINAELQRKLDTRSKRPRRKFISASTSEYRYAAYMEAWRAKVERVGNLNYPDLARRRNLSGDLLLDVALNPDGSVRDITVRRSSGHKVLDDAAIRIVDLAAPFAPFPEDILKEVDILHITRTWKFLNSHQFSGH